MLSCIILDPCLLVLTEGFLGGSDGKESACNVGNLGLILGSGRSPGGGNAIYSSILAWRIPWTEEPVRLQSLGSQRVGHDWLTHTHTTQPLAEDRKARLQSDLSLNTSLVEVLGPFWACFLLCKVEITISWEDFPWDNMYKSAQYHSSLMVGAQKMTPVIIYHCYRVSSWLQRFSSGWDMLIRPVIQWLVGTQAALSAIVLLMTWLWFTSAKSVW